MKFVANITGSELYELLLVFAFCAIAGWLIEEVLMFVKGYAVNRGILTLPINITSGLTGLLIVAFQDYMPDSWIQLIIIAVGCLILELLAMGLVKAFSGGYLWKFSVGTFLLHSAVGIAFAMVIAPNIIEWVTNLPLWFDWAFLCVFYILLVSGLFEGCSKLIRCRRGKTLYCTRWKRAYLRSNLDIDFGDNNAYEK